MKKFLVVLLLALIILPYTVLAAAWSATENFDSYSAGGINGDNAGTGWSAAWSTASGVCNVTTAQAQTSPNSLLIGSAATGCDVSRTLTTGVTSGSFRIYLFVDNLPTGTKGFIPAIFYEGATLRFRLDWGSGTGGTANTLWFGNGTTEAELSTGPTVSTWHYVDVEFDQANNRARASYDGGAFSSYITAAGGSFTQIDKYRATAADSNAADQGYYVDSFQATPATVTTSFCLWCFHPF